MDNHKAILRRLAIGDETLTDAVLSDDKRNLSESTLDPKTHALVRIGALIAIDATPASYLWTVESAYRHGATVDEVVGTLLAVMPVVGTGRVVSAAPKLGLAVGYDVADAIERFEWDEEP